MMALKTASYLFIILVIALFSSMLILTIYSGVEPFQALIWGIANLLNITYPAQGLIPYSLAINSTLILVADTLGALCFAVLTAFLTAIFYSFMRNLNLRQGRMMRKIRKLRRHVIISPFNGFAEAVVDELEKNHVRSVVITNSEREARHLYIHSKLAMVGNVNTNEMLHAAGLQHASAVILCSEDPTENALTAITVRTFNKRVKIIARVSNEEDLPKLSKAGTHMVILPEVAAGNWLGKIILDKVSKS